MRDGTTGSRSVMIAYVARRKNLILVFVAGFFIGILIEIAVVERETLSAIYESFLGKPQIACVILLKNRPSELFAAAERTWLGGCDTHVAVRVRRGRGFDDGTCEGSRVFELTAASGWSGLCKAFRLAGNGDWFLVVPENLLVLVENLRSFVRDLDPSEGHYFGHAVSHYDADYNALSAGVLVSRGTLRLLMERFESDEVCDSEGKHWRNEDVYLGKYLKEMGIAPKDTRDAEGRGRFHGYNINVLLSPGKLFKRSDYSRKALYPVPEGFNCCSPHLITIDASGPNGLYHHYFYIYKLRTEHRGKPDKMAKTGEKDGFDWRDFLREEGYNESAIEKITDEEYYQVWSRKITPESLYERMRKEFGS